MRQDAQTATNRRGCISRPAGAGDNYDITYVNGTLTVCPPFGLVAEAEVQVDTQGPIGTARTSTPVAYPPITFGITPGHLDGNLFSIDPDTGVLTFTSPLDNEVGDVYHVEITASDTSNFAFLGLHEAADKLAGFLCRIQVRSESHPELDGAWFRAFDFDK